MGSDRRSPRRSTLISTEVTTAGQRTLTGTNRPAGNTTSSPPWFAGRRDSLAAHVMLATVPGHRPTMAPATFVSELAVTTMEIEPVELTTRSVRPLLAGHRSVVTVSTSPKQETLPQDSGPCL